MECSSGWETSVACLMLCATLGTYWLLQLHLIISRPNCSAQSSTSKSFEEANRLQRQSQIFHSLVKHSQGFSQTIFNLVKLIQWWFRARNAHLFGIWRMEIGGRGTEKDLTQLRLQSWKALTWPNSFNGFVSSRLPFYLLWTGARDK